MSGSAGDTITVALRVWRQAGPNEPGAFEKHQQTVSSNASFLEMLDLLNEELNNAGQEPVRDDTQKIVGFEFCWYKVPRVSSTHD